MGSQRGLEKTSPVRQASLRAADTFESINELGSLELMSKDLGLAPYGPLKKSISADSLSSISSIGNNFGQDVTVGQVEVSMEYDGKAATLHVTLLQGKDLLEKEDTRFESCFMRISLLPAEQIVGISRVSGSYPKNPTWGIWVCRVVTGPGVERGPGSSVLSLGLVAGFLGGGGRRWVTGGE